MEHLDFLHGKKNLIWIFTLQKKNCNYGRSGFLHCKKRTATWPYKNWEHDEKLLEVGFISELKMMRIT